MSTPYIHRIVTEISYMDSGDVSSKLCHLIRNIFLHNQYEETKPLEDIVNTATYISSDFQPKEDNDVTDTFRRLVQVRKITRADPLALAAIIRRLFNCYMTMRSYLMQMQKDITNDTRMGDDVHASKRFNGTASEI